LVEENGRQERADGFVRIFRGAYRDRLVQGIRGEAGQPGVDAVVGVVPGGEEDLEVEGFGEIFEGRGASV
jgi:hypothetical protein